MIDLLSDYCKKIELDITDTQLQQFDDYYRFLVEKNKVMNLTTIIEKEDVVLKHFIDSIYIMKYTDFDEKKVIDIGTGAGFPGIPLAIMNPQTSFVLLDSLNKRINFLNEVCNLCNLLLPYMDELKKYHVKKNIVKNLIMLFQGLWLTCLLC